MNTLRLTISNALYNDPIILIDDQKVKFKKNEFGSYTYTHQTEKDKVDIKIYKYLEFSTPLWFLLGMFFFFISILGIFDLKPSKHYIKIAYHSTITLKENANVRLSFKKGEEHPIEATTECEVEEIENTGKEDLVVKKRMKILKASKAVCWILVAAVAILITVTQTM